MPSSQPPGIRSPSSPDRPAATPSAVDAEANGRAFLGLIRHVKDAYGDAVLQEVVEGAGDATKVVFARKIGLNDWVPYAAYVGFLRALDRRLGAGDRAFVRGLGAVAGQRDLGTIFKVFVAIASPERLIRSCSKIWPSYYRGAGRMEALAWEPAKTVLRISDFPGMHPLHCRLMEGWMIATMATIGCKVGDDARETACASRGGSHHEFTCSWTKA